MEPIAPQVKVAIIGAGFAGLGMAIRLKQDGEHDFVILHPGTSERGRALKGVVEQLGAATEQKPRRARVAVVMGLRYLVLAAGGYVILRFTALSLTAALSGLFISAAAVILEIIYELIYART